MSWLELATDREKYKRVRVELVGGGHWTCDTMNVYVSHDADGSVLEIRVGAEGPMWEGDKTVFVPQRRIEQIIILERVG